MNIRQTLSCAIVSCVLFVSCTLTAFADINLGNDDGAGFQTGTSNNYWGVYTDSGIPLNETEGLRVTIYDAQNDNKVFNTIDITGNVNISAASNMRHFAVGSELISKTAWLSYVGSTYNSISESDMTKFNNKVTSLLETSGYTTQYIAKLASIDIISENNTSNLESIKALLSDEYFLKNLCDLIGSGLTYEDIADGKYKIAFEPVAYFRYNGQNWAMSATECGLLNKYMKNYFSAGWNSTNNLRALLGPLTHSQLPRSAFLESKDLGISTYNPTDSDYYNGNSNYNSDTCIIRCMGIGVLSTNVGTDENNLGIAYETEVAEYHTDTDVYTSFNVMNIGDTPFVGTAIFEIKNSYDETPKIREEITGSTLEWYDGTTTVYTDYDVETQCYGEDEEIAVFIDNPRYAQDGKEYGIKPYIKLGNYKNGDIISLGSAFGGNASISYEVTTSNGKTIKSGTVDISCPADEEAMGWFDWHTPTKSQYVTITLESNNENLVLVDGNGNQCDKIVLQANVEKIEEITPPDPIVSDKRPSWQKIYSMSSVQDKIAEYAPVDGSQELSWYTWTYDISWDQDETSYNKQFWFWDYYINRIGLSLSQWGVDNTYYASERATKKIGQFYEGAVYISTNNIEMRKVTQTVSLSADMKIYPSDHCYTATYSNSTGKYTMKSGYGIQIAINAHLSGDTEFCTGSQAANVLFPEFNYNLQSTVQYNRLLEKVGTTFVFKKNEYSTYNDRVHFTPIWYPNGNYTVYAEVFDVWCPAGQLSVRLTDQMTIKGNVYDDWHIAPAKP